MFGLRLAFIYKADEVYNKNIDLSNLAKYAKGDRMSKFIIVIALFLAGCSTLEGPADFDNNEYGLANRLFTLAEVYKVDCSNPDKTKKNFDTLAEISLELVNYSADIPNNQDTVALIAPMHKMISEADIKFNTEGHTATYCKLKLDNIETAAGIVKHAVAQRRIK